MQTARTEARPGTLGGKSEKRAGAKPKKSKREKGLSGQSRRRSQKYLGAESEKTHVSTSPLSKENGGS